MQPMLLLLRSYLNPWLLFVFILSLTCGYAQAHAGAQNDHPVTLNGNTTLRAVFKAIKQQTGFAVMYSTAATALNQDEKVSVNFKETPLDDVLAYVLRGKELEWKYSDDVLVIHKKEAVPAEKKMVTDSTVTPAMLTGKVTDADSKPVIGATIQVKGTNQGTTTDANGNFSLAKVNNGSTLVISSLGFEKREMIVAGRRVLMQLNSKTLQLDEGVAIAYGTTTQRLSTGNIAVIKAKDIEKQPVNNPLLALQGRVPGLFITQANGLPGSGITVRIQGQNSILNGNTPLYVIDGIPYPSELPAGSFNISPLGNSGGTEKGRSTGSGNALSYINPSDIESISVLKDADATAIYGSRAANGAILITTKRGKEGKTTFDLNIQTGWGKVTRKLQMLNTPQYLEMRHEAFANDKITPTVDDAPDLFLWDTTRYTDWQKTLIGGTARYTNVNASLSGGNATTQYIVRGTYQKETTVMPGDFSDQRGSLYFNLNTTSVNQKFGFQLSGSYLVDNNQLPATDLTRAGILTEPNAPPLYNPDGTLNWMPNASGSSTWENPVAILQTTYQNKSSNILGNAVLSYKILPELELRTSLGYNSITSLEFNLTPLTAINPINFDFIQRNAYYGNKQTSSWIAEPQLTYNKNIGQGKMELLLGATIQQINNDGTIVQGLGYNSDLVLKNVTSATSLIPSSSFATIYKYAASFARLNYNWQDKYILNLTARRDGSSRFGIRNRLSNFGAVGLAWIFTEEKILKEKLSFLSFGKLRASYGLTGSDQIGEYSYLSLYNPVIGGVPYQGTLGIRPAGLSNPFLEWEATKKLQLGLELSFLKDRLFLNANYARNRSSNQLLSYALPAITGYTGIYQNFPATIQNISWEFSLNTVNLKTKSLNWSSTVNLTIPRNKLISFPDLATSTYASLLVVGQPASFQKLFHFLGTDPATGEYILADATGKPTTTPNFSKDQTVLLNSLPRFYGGFQNSFNYKGFQLDLLFQFVNQKGYNVLFANGSGTPPGGFYGGFSNQPATVLSRWQKPGDITNIQRYSAYQLYSGYAQLSDASYRDASYVRLKNMSISYQLPQAWIQKYHVQNFRFFLQGQNLLTITKYHGLDPETQGFTSLPPLKILTIGAQVTF